MAKVQRREGSQELAEVAAHAEDAALLLRSLANPQRLLILCQLVEGEVAVSQIQSQLDLSQSALSQHLAVLREAGVVVARREGLQVFYRLLDGPANSVMQALYQAYCAPGA